MRRQDGDPAVLIVGGRTSPSLMVSGGGRLSIARPDFRWLVKSLEGDFAILCVYEGGAKRPFLFAELTIVEDICRLDGRRGRGHSTVDPRRPVPRYFGLEAEAFVVTGGAIEAEEFRYCLLHRVGLTAYQILYATTSLSDAKFVNRTLCGRSADVATIEGGPLCLV